MQEQEQQVGPHDGSCKPRRHPKQPTLTRRLKQEGLEGQEPFRSDAGGRVEDRSSHHGTAGGKTFHAGQSCHYHLSPAVSVANCL